MAKFKVTSNDNTHDSLEPMRTQFPKGSVIFAEGDLGLAMFVIESGAVEIRKHLGGEERVLATLAPCQLSRTVRCARSGCIRSSSTSSARPSSRPRL